MKALAVNKFRGVRQNETEQTMKRRIPVVRLNRRGLHIPEYQPILQALLRAFPIKLAPVVRSADFADHMLKLLLSPVTRIATWAEREGVGENYPFAIREGAFLGIGQQIAYP